MIFGFSEKKTKVNKTMYLAKKMVSFQGISLQIKVHHLFLSTNFKLCLDDDSPSRTLGKDIQCTLLMNFV